MLSDHIDRTPGDGPFRKELFLMKRIQTLETRDLAKSLKTGGCGECQTSCQSACKTSCGLANQQCENSNR
jgi:predicted ribosomally synthesized six-cysteine peptide SCIFF